MVHNRGKQCLQLETYWGSISSGTCQASVRCQKNGRTKRVEDGGEMRWNKGRQLHLLGPKDLWPWPILLWTCAILQDKGRTTLKAIQISSVLPPRFQQAGWGSPRALGLWPLPCGATEAGPLSMWVWKAKHWAKKDYSWASRSIFTYLGPVTPSFFPISLFWNKNVCPTPIPSLTWFLITYLEINFASGWIIP